MKMRVGFPEDHQVGGGGAGHGPDGSHQIPGASTEIRQLGAAEPVQSLGVPADAQDDPTRNVVTRHDPGRPIVVGEDRHRLVGGLLLADETGGG